jgi:adenine-specific DNA-methyltransferase
MTELIWDGKYDKDGKRVAPLRVMLPFQTVETVNESTEDRRLHPLFPNESPTAHWRNRLIWGDKKYVLPSLLPEFAGKVNLIYIDPPFAVGQNFSFTATIPDNPETEEDETTSFIKEPSIIEQKAYRDTWGKGLDSYLAWMYETLVVLRELLAENGSIFVHLDVHRGPYIKGMLDEVFGVENFQNEIAWYYYNKLHGATKRCVPKAFDQILYYVKSRGSGYTFHTLSEPREQPVKKLKYRFINGEIRNLKDENGKTITYVSTERQIDNVWRIRCLQPANQQEWVNYDTQKPVDLIERILSISSNEGDLILDCFCGSGSSLVAAERMRRHWIGCDLSRFAIHTTRKRLLGIENVQPFVVQNLGKYERQAWQAAEFGEQAEPRVLAYRKFILDLYHAEPTGAYTYLHGLRHGRMVYVGAVDAPISMGDVTNIVTEFRRAIGTGKDAPTTNGIDVLGWDFAFEMNEVAKQQAAKAKVDVRFLRIPHDAMDKRAVEQGDVRFFELAALSVDIKKLKLTDFCGWFWAWEARWTQ